MPEEAAPAGEGCLELLQEALPRFLPGLLRLREASSGDYRQLAQFHYRAPRPATWAKVLAITHLQQQHERVVAVGVLSWPTAVSRGRRAVFGLAGLGYGQQIRFANRHVRTISRVIVHPQFRGLGLGRVIVQGLCALCPTRYVEATAAMGVAHPLFERAGMHRHESGGAPAYFWLDRNPDQAPPPLADGCAGLGAKI